MDVSIVIVSYNTCRILDECIASIKRETNAGYEIIVVDNASTDDSCRMLLEKYPEVVLIENSENAGFARANNQGFAIARGKYFFMLNSDTLILDKAIDRLVDFMEKNPDIGICGPRNIGRDGKIQYNCDHFPGFWNTLCYYAGLRYIFPASGFFNRCNMRYWDYSETKDVDRIVGCSLMIRSGLFKRLGGLDEKYFMYFEETDFCFRSRNNGVRTTYFPHAEIIHYGGESAKNDNKAVLINKLISSYFFSSQYYFFRKNYGVVSMLAIRGLDLVYGIILVIRNSIRSNPGKKESGMKLGKVLIMMAVGCR